MLGGPKFASDTEVQSVIHQWFDNSQQHSLHRPFRSLLTDGTKCLNKLGRYIEN